MEKLLNDNNKKMEAIRKEQKRLSLIDPSKVPVGSIPTDDQSLLKPTQLKPPGQDRP